MHHPSLEANAVWALSLLDPSWSSHQALWRKPFLQVQDSRGGGHTQLALPSGRPKVSMFLETTKKELVTWTEFNLDH